MATVPHATHGVRIIQALVFMFHFDDDEESMDHGYAWTTLAMLRAGHSWIQANGMVAGRKGKIFLCFDGNFDVVASKRVGRVHIRLHDNFEGAVSAGSHVLQDWRPGDDAEEDLPPDSEEENTPPRKEDVQGWVSVIITTDQKKFDGDRLVSSGVPLCALVSRSENQGIITRTVLAWLDLIVEEYPAHYDEINCCFVRSDNGSATRGAAHKLMDAAPVEHRRTPSGCYVHEMLKASEGKATWEAQFGQLRRKWKNADTGVPKTEFNDAYTGWMRSAHRCPTHRCFKAYGQRLAAVAEGVGAPRSAAAFRLKFSDKRLPFHSGATGIAGVPSHNQSIESLHAFFDREVFGRGLLSHKAYFECVAQNSQGLAKSGTQSACRNEGYRSASDDADARESARAHARRRVAGQPRGIPLVSQRDDANGAAWRTARSCSCVVCGPDSEDNAAGIAR